MSEPVFMGTKTAKTARSWTEHHEKGSEDLSEEIEVSIVYEQCYRDDGETLDMYEGVISAYVESQGYVLDIREWNDSKTFDNEENAIEFIRDSLDEWGFTDNDLLIERLIRKQYKKKHGGNQL